MPGVSKGQTIITCLKSVGYRDVTWTAIPTLFRFKDEQELSELEFA